MIKYYSSQSTLTIEITRAVEIFTSAKHEHLNQKIIPQVLKQLSKEQFFSTDVILTI